MLGQEGLKSVEEMKGIQQTTTELRLSDTKQGFPINFNVERLMGGLRSFVLRSFIVFMSFMVTLPSNQIKCEDRTAHLSKAIQPSVLGPNHHASRGNSR